MEKFKGNENYKFSTPIPNIIGQKHEGYKSTYTNEVKIANENPISEDGQETEEKIIKEKVTSVITDLDENIKSNKEMVDFRQVNFAFSVYPLPKGKKF